MNTAPVSVTDDDEQASFYRSLQQRYGQSYPVRDAAVRVVLTIRPQVYVTHGAGSAPELSSRSLD